MTTASEHPQTGRRSKRHHLLKDNVTVIADAVLPVYLNPAGKPDESDAVVRADQFMPDANQQLARAEYRLAVELSRSGEKDFAEKYFARAGELSRRLTTSRSAADRCRYAGRDPFGEAFCRAVQGVGGRRPAVLHRAGRRRSG